MKADDTLRSPHEPACSNLGICWILYRVVRLFEAIWLVSCQIRPRSCSVRCCRECKTLCNDERLPIYLGVIGALSVVCGVLGIFAGWTVLAGQGFGRTLALLAGFLSLSDIPLGMTLGIYTLALLFPGTRQTPGTLFSILTPRI